MSEAFVWSKETYEASLVARCWWCTIYDDGWDGCERLRDDGELRAIVQAEGALAPLPQWAEEVIERNIRFLPLCGHYRFPLAYREAVAAIGAEEAPNFVHGCFTVEGERKRQMADYVFCLDAWLAGATPAAAAAELNALACRIIDWDAVCADLWGVLGEPTEPKRLLVERLIHSQRLKIKQLPWDDDRADRFGRDAYLGDFIPPEAGRNPGNECAYSSWPAPAFDEAASPRVRQIERRLKEICPDAEWFLYTIRYGWLCAPKAFRFLERLIWAIGKGRPVHTHDHPLAGGGDVPGFLRIEDTLPDAVANRRWWDAFLASLKAWPEGDSPAGRVADEVRRLLGEPTAVKRWLVRLLVRKLELPEGRAVVPRGQR